ncbi:MAG: ATP-binding protein [Litorivicinus sp.]
MARLAGLRRQLLPYAVLLIALPWLGWQTLHSVDELARDSETQALRLVGQALVRQLAATPALLEVPGSDVELVPSINFALQIDGFLDEWPAGAQVYQDPEVTVHFAQYRGQVYGVIQSSSREASRWQLSWPDASVIALSSPNAARVKGRVTRAGVGESFAVARWDRGSGYQLEFAVPKQHLPQAGRVRLSSDHGLQVEFDLGLHSESLLNQAMMLSDDRQITIFNATGQYLAATPALRYPSQLEVSLPIYSDNGAIGHAQFVGRLSEAIARSTQALFSLVAQVSVVVCVLVGGLFWVSTRLSRRIRRLQRELSVQLSRPRAGSMAISFTDSQKTDEIGRLSREMQQLLGEVARYNQFLMRIPRTLRHELANPMSTIQSSLELLEDETDPVHQARLRSAAIRGINKLNQTLTQITEAANLEESLAGDAKYPLHLQPLMTEYLAVCRQAHPDYDWRLQAADEAIWICANDLRIEQMLDKLIDNARSFTPKQGVIEIRLLHQMFSADIEVWNQGSALTDKDESECFRLFSGSRNDSPGGHLGLGLFVVQQIALSLGATAAIQNQGQGVCVSIRELALMDGVPQR